MVERSAKDKAVLDWLLEDEQPPIRYLALTQLLGKPEGDAEVRAAKKAISERGWASDLLESNLRSFHPGHLSVLGR